MMHIQDAFHPDGISFESGDELDETETDPRSSPTKDQLGKDLYKIIRNILFLFLKQVVRVQGNLFLPQRLQLKLLRQEKYF